MEKSKSTWIIEKGYLNPESLKLRDKYLAENKKKKERNNNAKRTTKNK